MKPRGFTAIAFILVALVVLSASLLTYVTLTNKHRAAPSPAPISQQPGGTACSMEAKQCPDGSYVGRAGANCEFTACPVVTTTNDCSSDSDCKLISNDCTCAAVLKTDLRTTLFDPKVDPYRGVCKQNECTGLQVPVTAVCQQNKCVRSDKAQVAVDTSTWKTYRNETLGITFNYPKSWGDIQEQTTYTPPTRIEKIFSFSAQPYVDFALSSVITPAHSWIEYHARYLTETRKYEPNFDGYGQYVEDTTVNDICRGSLDGNFPTQTKFGDCVGELQKYPYVVVGTKSIPNVAWDKTTISEKLLPLTAHLSFEEFVGVPLNGSLYTMLTVRARSLKEQLSQNYLTNVGLSGKRQYGYMTDPDMAIIKASWAEQMRSDDFAASFASLLGSIEVFNPTQTDNYDNYLRNKKEFTSKDLPVTFVYPVVFGEPKESALAEDTIIKLDYFQVFASSRQQAKLSDDKAKRCRIENPQDDGPFPTCPDADFVTSWDKEQSQLETKKSGETCNGLSYEGFNSDIYNCQIRTVNGRTVIVGYTGFGGPYSSGSKIYIYFDKGKRYVVTYGSYSYIAVDDVIKAEQNDIGAIILNQIAESIKIND